MNAAHGAERSSRGGLTQDQLRLSVAGRLGVSDLPAVAQRIERLLHKSVVAGSNPAGALLVARSSNSSRAISVLAAE